MPMIYGIFCKSTGFVYVGCTGAKLNKRMREHRCLLNQRRHTAVLMQQDWVKYGADDFEARVLEVLPDDASVVVKRVRELYWMQVHQETLYNAHQVSFSPTPEAIRKGVQCAHNEPGNRWTTEANMKRSLAQKGKPKGHGEKISATKKANALARKLGLMR